MIIIYNDKDSFDLRGMFADPIGSFAGLLGTKDSPEKPIQRVLKTLHTYEIPLNDISCIYIMGYETYETSRKTIENYDSTIWNSNEITKLFPNKIKLLKSSNLDLVLEKCKTEQLIYSSSLHELPSDKLKNIPPKNLNLIIKHFKPIIDDSELFFKIVDNVLPQKGEMKKINYDPDEILYDLIKFDRAVSIPANTGYIFYLDTPDKTLAEFLISLLVDITRSYIYKPDSPFEEIGKQWESVIIYDIDKISFQHQNNLRQIISQTDFNYKPVFICGKEAKIHPSIALSPNYISTKPFSIQDIKSNLIEFLCFYYKRTVDFAKGRRLNSFNDFYEFNTEFQTELLHKARNFDVLLKSLDEAELSSPSDFNDSLFLYNVSLFIKKNSETTVEEPKKKEGAGYIWKFRGAIWEISFNYPESFFVNDTAAFFYLAAFLENAGHEVNIPKLRLESGIAKNKKILYHLNSLRTAINEAIKVISDNETKLELKNDLSEYLKNAIRVGFFNNELKCTWPNDPNIKWQVFRPIFYNIKATGKNNPGGKSNKVKQ